LLDILSVWPKVSDKAQTALVERGAYQWIVLFNVYGDKLSVAKETHEEQLLRGVPSDRKGKMKEAIDDLMKEGVLTTSPKEGHPVYHANSRHPIFQNATNIQILEQLRINDSLKKALINETPLLKRIVAPDLRAAIDRQWGKKKSTFGFQYEINVGESPSEAHGDYSARLECFYPCPERREKIGPFTFEVKDAGELFDIKVDIICKVCKKVHWVGPDASIRSYE
jgi:hypothetical protein